jgi:hypothetical protein
MASKWVSKGERIYSLFTVPGCATVAQREKTLAKPMKQYAVTHEEEGRGDRRDFVFKIKIKKGLDCWTASCHASRELPPSLRYAILI